jgi:chorismate synthase
MYVGSSLYQRAITNGDDIMFRVSIKPTSSIGLPQDTFNFLENAVDTWIPYSSREGTTCSSPSVFR